MNPDPLTVDEEPWTLTEEPEPAAVRWLRVVFIITIVGLPVAAIAWRIVR